MRGTVVALALAAGVVLPAAALENVGGIVTARERELAQAVVAKNADVLQRYLHPEFHVVELGTDHATTDRDAYLAEQSDPAWAVRTMSPVSVKVEPKGRVAIATIEMQVGWGEGIDRPARWLYTDVWTDTDTGWRMVGRFMEPTK